MFLSREDSECGASQEVWTGSVQRRLAKTKSWFDRLLIGMVEAGFGIPALCLYLTLSEPELLARVSVLGLPTPHDRPMRRAGGRNPWTAAEIRQLIEWWGEGIRVSRIADALGRSKSGIYAKKRRLGLSARDRKGLIDRNPLDGSDVCLGAGFAATEHPKPASFTGFVDLVTWRERANRGEVEPANREHAAAESNCRGSDVSATPDLGSVRLGTASPELLAAIREVQRIARRQTAGWEVDWGRSEASEDEVLEVALRLFSGQSRFGAGRDMGISAQAAADRLSRVGLTSVRKEWRARGWGETVDRFDVGLALERFKLSGVRATVCQELHKLFFVGQQDRADVHLSPDYYRNHGYEAADRRLQREKATREKALREKTVRESGKGSEGAGNSARVARQVTKSQRLDIQRREQFLAGLEETFAAIEAEFAREVLLGLAA